MRRRGTEKGDEPGTALSSAGGVRRNRRERRITTPMKTRKGIGPGRTPSEKQKTTRSARSAVPTAKPHPTLSAKNARPGGRRAPATAHPASHVAKKIPPTSRREKGRPATLTFANVAPDCAVGKLSQNTPTREGRAEHGEDPALRHLRRGDHDGKRSKVVDREIEATPLGDPGRVERESLRLGGTAFLKWARYSKNLRS